MSPRAAREQALRLVAACAPDATVMYIGRRRDSEGRVRFCSPLALEQSEWARRACALVDGKVAPPFFDDGRALRVNQFCRNLDGLTQERRAQHEAFRLYYAPLGVERQLRMLAFDGDAFVGWIAALELGGATARPTARVLQAQAARIRTLLIGAHRVEEGALPDSTLQFIVAPQGEIQFASPGAQPWLQRGHRDALRSFVRQLDSASGSAQISLAGAQVRALRMEGEGRSTYLVSIDPGQTLIVPPVQRLAPRRWAVARLAAQGASSKEIADALGMAVETVRHHLKGVYKELGVGGRADLARALADDGEAGAG